MKIALKFFGVAMIGLAVAACGGGGSDDGGSDAIAPTLGITSVQKVGATAIPNGNVSSKPVFASNFLRKGWSLAPRQAFAQPASCLSDAPTSFDVSGGKIWVKQAYAILDEVEFNREPSTTPSPEFGPFALDLTNSDDTVGEAITVDVPEGNYSGVKYRIKRVDDTNDDGTPMVILNVTDSAAFKNLIMNTDVKRRPSVWIEGVIGVGSEAAGFSSCKDFTFVTDHRWEVTVPFQSSSAGSTALDAVLLFDLSGAFNAALAGSSAEALSAEVGQCSSEVVDRGECMGPVYLDGRTKDERHGTPLAKVITGEFPKHTDVFVQSVTAARGFDDNPSISDMVDSTAPAGTTVIDDSAVRVSGDDNPSVSDLAETPG
ncbi:hypothetical protein [Candidatus Manganitrophus noduliformans]|uniref:Uncharacterized protein n=1 Tax=Candidatus Manganitrophus noduliformans TaxID=2606439 RepID=A0A7X6DVD1_9BACT|nr:hypothetical protein [Candidatus Manganitrophus noduliformans]NKE73759.1 hypothetical protein [Candidatus Manganitrophus noduliformans]